MTTTVTTVEPTHSQWLDALPAGWEVVPLKYVATVFPSNVDKHSREDETPVELCNYTDVYYNDIISADIDFMKATATSGQIERFQLRSGDTIITKDSESADDIGMSAYVPEDLDGVVCGYHLSMIRPGHRVSGRYIKRLFDSHYVKAILEISANGLTRVGLGQYALDNIDIPLPPLSSQNAIAIFLDRETAKIDALIDKQKQLIATLREDRAATITQAVTKGLDPNTKMKASGVQWISEIPETWNVLRLSWMFATISSGTTPDSKNLNYYGGEVNWVTTGELREGYVGKTTSRVTDLALADHSALRIYEPGSLVIAMYGATIGRLGILSAPACTNQACCVFSKPKQTDVRFIYYVLQAAREHLLVLASGGGQPNINQDKLRALRVPAPNFDTQRKISEYLDERCSKIDALIDKSTEAIKVLREYRSALITNAVTGKIDVREAV